MSIGLIVWTIACLGVSLVASEQKDILASVGIGCIIWALGMALWMLAGAIVGAS